MLRIIVTNPEEVARRRSPLANFAAAIAPDFIRQKVDEGIAERLIEQLAAEGVRARVLIEPNPPDADA
ncbi:MAG TPA: hypothetical protein VHE37_08270 [Nevskiaceae bacterium]|nr:hypothetical protein [Nevskiaceae bacterium]